MVTKIQSGLHALTSLAAVYILICASLSVDAQQIESDTIDFTTIQIWDDLRSCLKDVFNTCGFLGGCRDNVALEVGCQTNACLCRASTLGEAVEDAMDLSMSYCSNYDDQSSATSILTSYCSVRGYTSIVAPTIVTTGASTVTITTAESTETVTATATVTTAVPTETVIVSSSALLSAGGFLFWGAIGCVIALLAAPPWLRSIE
jgi:FtsH-binding integral membrane protein